LDERSLKQKLRQLKKIEYIVRFGTAEPGAEQRKSALTWDTFFSSKGGLKPRYPIESLLIMNAEARKRVFADYLYTVYTEGYKRRGMLFPEVDYRTFFDFDLPPNATKEDIKKRFRELAKIVHPDHGGSNEAMVALLEQYHKLLDQ